MDKKPRSFFKSNSYIGTCLLLHGDADSQESQEEPSEERFPKRSLHAKGIDRFTACPSGGAHQMRTDRHQPREVRLLKEKKRRPLQNLPPQNNLNRIQRKRKLVEYTGDETISAPQCGQSRAAEARMNQTLGKVLDASAKIFFPNCSTVKRTKMIRHVTQKITPRRIGGDKCKGMATPSSEEYKELRRRAAAKIQEHNDPAAANSSVTSCKPTPTSPYEYRDMNLHLPCSPEEDNPFGYDPDPVFSPPAQQASESNTEPPSPLEADATATNQDDESNVVEQRPVLQAEATSTITSITTTSQNGGEIVLGAKQAKLQAMVEKAQSTLGSGLFQLLKTSNRFVKPAQCLPILSLLGGGEFTKRAVELAIGKPLYSRDWNNIKIHNRYPGPLAPVEQKEIYRLRIPSEFLTGMLRFLNSSAVSQRFAYGNKIMDLMGGGTQNLDNVSLRSSILATTEQFLNELFEEYEKYLLSILELPPDDERCTKTEKGGSSRRCMKCSEHDGKCQFTPGGSISASSVRMLIDSLTGPELKALAALDDVKVWKGRDNWIRARKLTKGIFGEGTKETDEMIKRIDDQETYYVTDFVPHLGRVSDNKCNCLTCGFCEEGSDICCPKLEEHGPSCTRCADGFAIFEEQLQRIQQMENEMESREPPPSPLELQNLDQQRCDVKQCIADLITYHGHLARHASEDEQAMEAFANMDDDTAWMIADWKMKLLAMFFHESQRQYFGKRGTPCFGSMIATNPIDEESRNKKQKDVRFVMMVTDDQCQDDWAVACAKAYIYEVILPQEIKKVIFNADGAGCFKSKLMRAIQGYWKYWTGVDEVVYRVSPAGDGKTELDGMFGRMSQILRSSVVQNQTSYHDCDTILQTIEKSNGLSATTFVGFQPNRENQLIAETADKNDKFSSSILGSVLTEGCNEKTNELSRAFKHMGYGKGEPIWCERFNLFLKDKTAVKQKKYDKKDRISFYDDLDGGVIDVDKLKRYKPDWRRISSASNKKETAKSVVTTKKGTGKNSYGVRAKKRENRIEARSEKRAQALLDKRELIRSRGLFLCDKRHELSKAFCRKICLTAKGLEAHLKNGKCDFPSINARDLVLLEAGKPGGALANGSRPDRRSTSLSQPIVPAIPGTAGEVAAQCYQAFNRSDELDSKPKTEGMICFLLEQYGLPNKQDPRSMHENMRKMIDPKDGGLMFCSKKAHKQRNGWVDSVNSITGWISAEVTKREGGKISGYAKMQSLTTHLARIQNFKEENPSSYWKVSDGKTGAPKATKKEIVDSMLVLLEIRASNLKNIAEKRKVLIDLKLDQATFDQAVSDLAERIELLKNAMQKSIREGEKINVSW